MSESDDNSNSVGGQKSEHASTRNYGWRPALPDQRDFYLRFGQPQLDALTKIDHIDLSSGMPAPYDQGGIGACTAHAVAGVLHFLEIKQNAQDQTTPSRLFIYWNERYLDPYSSVKEDSGSTITLGIRAVKKYGFPPEALWPYDERKFTIEAPSSVYCAAVTGRITNYARVNQNLLDMQAALAAGNPIAFGFTVYESFEARSVASTGVVPMPRRHERAVGGHAVIIVGFDNTTQRFKVRNSWGSSWGDNGYFTVPYAYLTNPNLAGDFWVINALH
jgi:C1A family cysteine protease